MIFGNSLILNENGTILILKTNGKPQNTKPGPPRIERHYSLPPCVNCVLQNRISSLWNFEVWLVDQNKVG